MTVNILNIEEIISDPKIRSGKPIIAGTGIRVSDIVAYHLHGDKLTAEQIATDFRLKLGQVHAALAYYYLHQTEIDEEMRQNAEDADHWREILRQQGRLLE